ncbi:MAG: 30S ribosomal protein S6 [Anaerolineaceae bacterium]|nr:30S ribosomal protein S6 [Anaerolineaceae bacterium]
MRNYELVLILQPNLDEEAFNAAIDKVKGWISEAEGTVEKIDVWGKRRLAYPIRKQTEGQYVLLTVKMEPSFTNKLEANLRLMEPVMRFLVKLVESSPNS